MGAPSERDVHVLQMQLVGADHDAEPVVEQPLAGRVNYLLGNDRKQWHTDIPTFGRVGYRGVYPGVDVVYYGKGGQLEYDFVVAPSAEPEAIELAFPGANSVNIDSAGNLVLPTPVGEVRQAKPVAYQDIDGDRRYVSGRFALRSNDRVGFDLGSYDRNRPLVIDPVFVYSTHLGGTSHDLGQGVAVDAQGNAYVTGQTCSPDFPTASPLQGFLGSRGCVFAFQSYGDVFVTKLTPNGSLIYSTFLGGSELEQTAKVAVDTTGRAHVTGATDSTDFPTTTGAFRPSNVGDFDDIFFAKLNQQGSGLEYSTLLGGNNTETLPSIDLDADGNTFVVGRTGSDDFPSTPGAFQESGCAAPGVKECQSIFLAKISPEGNGASDLVYSTLLRAGGNTSDLVEIDVDASGHANLTGYANSRDFPTTPGAFQPECALNTQQVDSFQCQDAFVTRINPAGNGQDDLVYSTFLGGAASISGGNNADFRGLDAGRDVAVAADGTIYVVGVANTPDFPVTAGAYQPTLAGCSTLSCDAFIARINPAGAGAADLVYSTYLGGAGAGDVPNGLAIDARGRAVVSGDTVSTSFPTVDPLQSRCGCFTSILRDAFALVLDPVGGGESDLVFATFLGGTGLDVATDVAVDGSDGFYVVGYTDSPPASGGELGPKPYPTTPDALQPDPVGGYDAFVTRISLGAAQAAPGLSLDDVRLSEGDRGRQDMIFTVSIGQPTLEPVQVRLRTINGSARAGSDYRRTEGTIHFRTGQIAKTISVRVFGDKKPEPDETFELELYRSKGAPISDDRGTATVVNDD